ncbi:MAG: hypothetical protein DHS20C14_13940 [Phycisphaeraceae bacterium]|nr:MAG: hypothetical protein DHS20C14_13940 [Phycisphaeraceae bacterium]
MARNRGILALAALLWAQVCLILTAKLGAGQPDELLWMSHWALILAAVGLTLARPALVGVAFVLIAVPHTLWLADYAAGLVRPGSGTGLGRYLDGASPFVWASTAHHFYLLPLLAALCWRARPKAAASFGGALTVFAALLIASAWASDPWSNVNWAFAAFPTLDAPLVHDFNGLAQGVRLPLTAAIAAGLAFLPAAMLVRAMGARGLPGRMASELRGLWVSARSPGVQRAARGPGAYRA